MDSSWMLSRLPGSSTALILPEILSKELVQPETRLLVSLSGGQDSMFLAFALYQLEHQWRFTPYGLYHNHGTQKDNWYMGWHCLRCFFYFEWAGVYTLSFYKQTNEQEGWQWRTHLRSRLSKKLTIQTILIGHTKSDVAESAMFHLLRVRHQRRTPFLHWSTPVWSNKTLGPESMFVRNQLNLELSPKRRRWFETATKHASMGLVNSKEYHSPLYKKLSLQKRVNQFSFQKCRNSFVDMPRKVFKHESLQKSKIKEMPSKSLEFTKDPLFLSRPLLGLTRNELNFLCTYWKLPVYSDQTNLNIQNTRSQLRYVMFPLLDSLGFLNSTENLANQVEESLQDESFFQDLVKKLGPLQQEGRLRGLPAAVTKRFEQKSYSNAGQDPFVRPESFCVYWPGRGIVFPRREP